MAYGKGWQALPSYVALLRDRADWISGVHCLTGNRKQPCTDSSVNRFSLLTVH